MPPMSARRSFFGTTALILLAGVLILAFFSDRTHEYASEEFLMDTLVSIRVYGNDPDNLRRAAEKAFAEMRRIEDLTDRFALPGTAEYLASDICRVNEQAGQKPVPVSPDVFAILELSQKYYRLTDGAFDVTIGPVMDLWDFGSAEEPTVPAAGDIAVALKLVNNEGLMLDKLKKTVFLKEPGMALDLGGIAKGYATQRAAEILQENNVTAALINAGGNIKVMGQRAKKAVWKIGIQDPRDSAGLLGTLDLEPGQSCVTSGDYNRFFLVGDKRYHHIISPQTGYPAGKNISVTIVTKDPAIADILSTALFVLEPEKALEFAEKMTDTEAFLVTAEKKILFTPGLRAKLELQSKEAYRYDQD